MSWLTVHNNLACLFSFCQGAHRLLVGMLLFTSFGNFGLKQITLMQLQISSRSKDCSLNWTKDPVSIAPRFDLLPFSVFNNQNSYLYIWWLCALHLDLSNNIFTFGLLFCRNLYLYVICYCNTNKCTLFKHDYHYYVLKLPTLKSAI